MHDNLRHDFNINKVPLFDVIEISESKQLTIQHLVILPTGLFRMNLHPVREGRKKVT